MSLLSAQDEQVLKQHLSVLDKQVTVLLFTQAIGGSDSGVIAKQVLDEVAQLNEKIAVVEKNFVLDTDDRGKYGITMAPGLVFLSDGQDTRMRMYGAPTGYEFVGLIEALVIAGTGQVDLEDDTLALLAGVDTPTSIRVFSTPA